MSQLARLTQILLRLPQSPRFLTAKQLLDVYRNEGFSGVYAKKAERDIDTLTEMFPGKIGSESYEDFHTRTGITMDGDHTEHVFWEREMVKPIDLASLTVPQALSLSLLQKFLIPLLPQTTFEVLEPFFDEASHKLDDLKDQNVLSSWLDKIAIVHPNQPLLMPTIDTYVHRVVSEALLYGQQLQIQYRRADDVVNEYQVNPLGLVLRNGSCYLVASKAQTDDKRSFALHRFIEATQLDTKARYPDNWDLQRFIDEGGMGFDLTGDGAYQRIQFKAIFDAITTKHLSESRLSEDQVIKKLDDQHFEISATVQETEQLFWWLLSFGSRVEVLEPQHLRTKIARTVRDLADKYADVQ